MLRSSTPSWFCIPDPRRMDYAPFCIRLQSLFGGTLRFPASRNTNLCIFLVCFWTNPMTKPTSESVHHHVKKNIPPNKIPLGVPWIQGKTLISHQMDPSNVSRRFLSGERVWALTHGEHHVISNYEINTHHPKVLKIITQKMNHKIFPWPSQSPIQSPLSPPTSPVVAPTSRPCQVVVAVRRRPPWPWRAPREPRGTGSSGAVHGDSSENAMAWRFRCFLWLEAER